jgi:putative NADH-flavin reductase
MMIKVDLKKEVGSLDILIAALSAEMVETPQVEAEDIKLVKEMQEALDQLRQERGVRKMLLSAFETTGPNVN